MQVTMNLCNLRQICIKYVMFSFTLKAIKVVVAGVKISKTKMRSIKMVNKYKQEKR